MLHKKDGVTPQTVQTLRSWLDAVCGQYLPYARVAALYPEFTPARVARAFQEVFAGYGDDAKKHLFVTFESKGEGVILEKDIPVYSVCEHHLLPFFGKAHVAYLPSGRVTGLSKIARTVEVYARRLQLQERLTEQIDKEKDPVARDLLLAQYAELTAKNRK